MKLFKWFNKFNTFYDLDPEIVRYDNREYKQPNGHILYHDIGYDKHDNIIYEGFSEFDSKHRLIKSKCNNGNKYWISEEENGVLVHNRVFPDGTFKRVKVGDCNTYDKQYGESIWR